MSIDAAALEQCSREPIHIPGSIQPHGLLLALEEPSLRCLQVSSNWPLPVGVDHGSLTVESLLPPEALETLKQEIQEGGPSPDFVTPVTLTDRQWDLTAHRHDGILILELEPAASGRASPYHRELQQAFQAMHDADGDPALYGVIASLIAKFTGYGRVMVYKFDRDWHGHVVGEFLSDPALGSYMGHHFPASDIPEQARALYTKNWLRIIPWVDYTAASLVPPLNPRTGRPLDLSFSILRSVSPIHLQYLKNMDVGASMSISLITGGRLWGLIACHHGEPRPLAFPWRTACELFGQMASLEIAAREESRRLNAHARATEIQTRFFDVIAGEQNFVEALTKYTPALLEFVEAAGAALFVNNRLTRLGATPPEGEILPLVEWLRSQPMTPLFVSDSLEQEYPPAEGWREAGSGLLAVRLSPVEFHCLLFFRPEVVTSVTWAGDPRKKPDASGILHPRPSFAAWVETVRGKSLPWTEVQCQGAVELRTALNAQVLRRTERLISLNAEMEKRNTDLQSFAYIAAHDLKEPLRNIAHYSRFIEEDNGATLDQDGLRKLKTIQALASQSEELLTSLARFSRIGRMDISPRTVDMDDLVDSALGSVQRILKDKGMTVVRSGPLGVAVCDPVLAREVFSNLIINAAKYSEGPEPRVRISRSSTEGPPVFEVADNGIGIPEKHWEVVFIMFRRLHPPEAYGGGTGTGLAIARSIVERHGGWIRVRSVPEEETVFSFTFA